MKRMRKKNLPWSEISKGRRNLWVKMQRTEWVNGAPKEWERNVSECCERGFEEKKKGVNSAPVPHLSAISRSSDIVSLKWDERVQNIKKPRASETVSPKTLLVQGILSQASHYLPKRVYQQKWLAQVLHISPRREMFSLGEISWSFGKLWFCHFSNFCSTFTHLIHDPFNPNNSKTHIKPCFNQFSIIPKGFTSTNSKSSF